MGEETETGRANGRRRRRRFLLRVGAVAGATVGLGSVSGCSGRRQNRATGTSRTTGTARTTSANRGTAQSAVEGWMDDVSNYEDVVDATDDERITVAVGAEGNGGNFAFDPPAVRVSPGTTVTWQWSGKGGTHNVVATDGTFDSGAPAGEAGTEFAFAFDDGGAYPYYCVPHKSLGMKGIVVVE